MKLKENSKAYELLLVSMVLSGLYSLVLTIWTIINNMGLPYASGVNITSTINAIAGRLPIIILCVLFIVSGRNIDKCLNALSVYYVSNIGITIIVRLVNIIVWHSLGNPFTLWLGIFFMVLAFIGIWDIKNGGRTGIFRGVLLAMTAYEVYINGSMIIGTARTLAEFPNYYSIQITSILTLVFYILFNVGQYIFVRDITVDENE